MRTTFGRVDALRDRLGAGGFGYIDGREVISQRLEAGHHQRATLRQRLPVDRLGGFIRLVTPARIVSAVSAKCAALPSSDWTMDDARA